MPGPCIDIQEGNNAVLNPNLLARSFFDGRNQRRKSVSTWPFGSVQDIFCGHMLGIRLALTAYLTFFKVFGLRRTFCKINRKASRKAQRKLIDYHCFRSNTSAPLASRGSILSAARTFGPVTTLIVSPTRGHPRSNCFEDQKGNIT